jgi:hypothetical protein
MTEKFLKGSEPPIGMFRLDPKGIVGNLGRQGGL